MNRFFRLTLRRPICLRQRVFTFLERSECRYRWFKRTILLFTALVVAVILGAVPRGRYVVASLASGVREVALHSVGLPTPRSEVDDRWQRFRLQGIADSKRAHLRMFADIDPAYRRLLIYAGLDPDHAVMRWGNYDRTMLLPSEVFEADDTGRSYRLRPGAKSVWIRNMSLRPGVLMFFLVPDRPELPKAMEGTTGLLVEGSQQTTNSWGLRGPDPDPDAPLRGIVLGDSFMQGLFIGDDQTPPECLRRVLEKDLQTKVSILNTGLLGYSPEQYHATLMAYVDRFRPHFVVVSVFANDFGDPHEAVRGRVDWDESLYWLNRISEFCRIRHLAQLFVMAPLESQIFGRRSSGCYPGTLSNRLEINGSQYLDPMEAFVDESLERFKRAEREGRRPPANPLFNGHISDHHFSALGSELWAACVGRRLLNLLEKEGMVSRREDPGAPTTRTEGRGGKNGDVAPFAGKTGTRHVSR
jgi:hypothetical protein